MAIGLLEMDRHLKLLVENALEEAQFEHAMALFDQIRSPHHRPSPILVLHTIFISLHSTARPSRLDDPSQPVVEHAELIRQSPRKMMKHQKSDVVLTPAAVHAAHRLLHAFLRTNPASALADALPFYPETKNPQPVQFEYIDSPIHPQAVALKNARTVWDVLRSDWIVKTYRASLAAQNKAHAKQRRSSALARDPSFSASFTDWTVEDEGKVVGDDAWHTLDWLVALFEADAEQSPAPKHSSILLRQLPLPTIGSHTRWDASEPLNIVFYAFKQTYPRRQRTGLRLFNLLLDLTQSAHLDLIPFASTVLSQISLASSASSSSHTHRSILTDLFTRLSSTSPGALSFKLVLCKKILALLEPEPQQQGSFSFSTMDAGAGAPPVSGGSALTTTTMSADMAMSVNTNTTMTASGESMAVNGGGGSPVTARPRIRPRPRPSVRMVVDDIDEGAGSPEKGKGKGKERKIGAEKEKEKAMGAGASAGSMPPPPLPAPAPAPTPAAVQQAPNPASAAQHIRIHLPPLAEIAHLVRLSPPPAPAATVPKSASTPAPTTDGDSSPKGRQTRRTSGRSSNGTPAPTRAAKGKANGKAKARQEGPDPDPRASAEPQAHAPWTTPPALLLRIKFELVRAWIGARGVKAAAFASAGGAGADGEERDKEMEKAREREREDAELRAVIDDVFGAKAGEQDVEEQEQEQREFYRDVLAVFLGACAGAGR